MEDKVNPYGPPQSTMREERNTLKTTPVLLVLFFAFITLGIYVPFWYWRRRHALNHMAPNKGVNGLCIMAFILVGIAFVGGFAFAITTEEAVPAPEQELPLQILNSTYAIVILILGFRVKGILEANYPDRVSGLGVFFLNLFYLQYKINRLGTGEPQTPGLGLT